MLSDDTRHKIKNITEGNVIEGQQDSCTTIRNLLCKGYATSKSVKKDFEGKSIIKKEQAKIIESYCLNNDFWIKEIPSEERYLTCGGEAKIYLHSNNKFVIKLNDAIYYATWLEYFNSILLHNLFFENTSYTLIGFFKESESLYAVLEQPYVISDAQVEMNDVKNILQYNGFVNTKRQDYVHFELGLILEDMHDENVLVNSEVLFFIDTVFYVTDLSSIY